MICRWRCCRCWMQRSIVKADFTDDADNFFKEVKTGDHAFKAGDSYVITSLGSGDGAVTTAGTE